MSKYQIYHTERNWAAGLPYGPAQSLNTREEGPQGGYDTRDEAIAEMNKMQAEAVSANQTEYANALHVEELS